MFIQILFKYLKLISRWNQRKLVGDTILEFSRILE